MGKYILVSRPLPLRALFNYTSKCERTFNLIFLVMFSQGLTASLGRASPQAESRTTKCNQVTSVEPKPSRNAVTDGFHEDQVTSVEPKPAQSAVTDYLYEDRIAGRQVSVLTNQVTAVKLKLIRCLTKSSSINM